MASPRFASFTSPGSYWQASRAPRYSLPFALPLLLCYQTLAVFLSRGPHPLRNGADVILQSFFVAIAGTRGPLLFMICLIALGLWLVVRDARARGSRLRASVFWAMLGESVVLALAFGVVVGGLTSRVIGALQALTLAPGGDLDLGTRLMVSLGAGIYEELLFRVVLVALLAAAALLPGFARVATGPAGGEILQGRFPGTERDGLVYLPPAFTPRFDFPLRDDSAHLTHVDGPLWARELDLGDSAEVDWTIPFTRSK